MLRDHVAWLEAGFVGGTSRFNRFDDNSVRCAEFPEQHGIIAAVFLEGNADRAARHFADGDELIVNRDGGVRGQRKTDTFKSAAARVDRGIDGNHFAGHVDERASGISGIDSGVGLNEALELMSAKCRAIFGADDSGRDRGIQTEGAAKSQYPVPDLHAVGITKLGDRKFAISVDFDHREIGILVDAHYMRAVFPRIAVDSHLDFSSLVDHMVICEDETFVVHDDARSEAALGIRPVIRRIEKAIEKILERIVQMMGSLHAAFRLLDHLGCRDIHDRRTDFLRNARKGTRQRDRIWNGQQ